MIVVSNTSPLNYLVQIESAEIIQQLFGSILIPQAVKEELVHPVSPAIVRNWMAKPPVWL